MVQYLVPVPPISRLRRCVQRTALENRIVILVSLAVAIFGLSQIFFSHWRGWMIQHRRIQWTLRGNWSPVLRWRQGLLFTVRSEKLLLCRSCHRCARPGCWHPAQATILISCISGLEKCFTAFLVTSVADPWHFGKDPAPRIRPSESLTIGSGFGSKSGSGSCNLQDGNKKLYFSNFFANYFLKLHYHFSKIKSHKGVKKQQ